MEGATTPSIPVDAGLDAEDTSLSMASDVGINYCSLVCRGRATSEGAPGGGAVVLLVVVVAFDDHRTALDTLSGGDGKCRGANGRPLIGSDKRAAYRRGEGQRDAR